MSGNSIEIHEIIKPKIVKMNVHLDTCSESIFYTIYDFNQLKSNIKMF